jgi:hypothetical protein
MGEREEAEAQDRAQARRLPFMMVGGLILLLGLGLVGAGLDKWPYTLGAITIGSVLIAIGELRAKR